jgi:hypothetical protein
MNEKKEQKTLNIIKMLLEEGHYVDVFENGQIKVAGVDFWCTSEKWYDSKRKIKGVGLLKFKKYLEKL